MREQADVVPWEACAATVWRAPCPRHPGRPSAMQGGARGFAPDASAPFAFVLVCQMIAELGGCGCDKCIPGRSAILRTTRSGSHRTGRARSGVSCGHRWCQLPDYSHPLAKIDTNKRSPADRPSPAASGGSVHRPAASTRSSARVSFCSATSVARVITSETACDARASVELAMWL